MKTDTKQTIVRLIQARERSVKELSSVLGVSTQAIHRHLKKLLAEGDIVKKGSAPRVVYQVRDHENRVSGLEVDFSPEEKKIISEHFMQIDPAGHRHEGVTAFHYWCQARNYDTLTRGREYVQLVNKYESQRKEGLLDATDKIILSFDDQGPAKMWYVDLYSYEIFGKTKLGQLVLYGKQSGDKKIIKEIADKVAPAVKYLMLQEQIEAVVFVPPTVKRPVQLMEEIKQYLPTKTVLPVHKIINDVAVPQKTLKSKQDRQINARETFVIPPVDWGGGMNVLLIDDAVGSGASFYEIGKKLRQQGIAGRVVCLSFVGSANDFPVINEA